MPRIKPRLALAAWLLLLAPLLALAAPRRDAELDARLQRLVLQAFDQPQPALQRLRAEQGGRPETLAQLQMAEGQILVQGGRIEAAEAVAAQMAGDPQQRGSATLLRALIKEREGLNRESAAAAEQSLGELEPPCTGATPDPRDCDFRATWQALRLVERDQIAQGRLAQAAATVRQALELARTGGDNYLLAISMGSLALLSQELEQPDEARRWLNSALALAEGDPQAAIRTKVTAARIAVRRGDKASQLQVYEEALTRAREAKMPRLAAQIQTSLTDLHMHNGRPAVALALSREALPVLLRFKDLHLERTLRHNTSVALIMVRQFEAARREIQRVGELAASQTDPVRLATEQRELGEAWAASGQPREAIAVFHAERRLSAQIHTRNREAQLQLLEAKYNSGRKQRDLELLTRDKTLKDQQLVNQRLAQRLGLALGALLALSLLLAALMVGRVRVANRQLRSNQRQLRAQSERDPLTQLANRRHLLAVMQQRAHEVFEGGLLMVDIDHFKHVNDGHGHASGDIVIREVGRRITEAVRQDDLVVRWGGEEFLVFAPQVGPEQLRRVAQRVLDSVGGRPVAIESGPLRVTASIGFAQFPLPPSRLPLQWEQAVNWADMALYTAKAKGRNCALGIVSVEAGDSAALLRIEQDFEGACSAQQVQLQHLLGPG